MDGDTLIGVFASIGTGISLLPQLIKLIKEKKPGDISYGMLGVLFIGLLLWIWYGIRKEDWIIIISNSVSVILNASIFILSLVYKKKEA
ncbi:MAG: hypothetical protein JWQ27_1558 [Ferruginibacter sp.]|nr:hypothetical protein [Ferruginibacter sp.]